VQVGPEVDLKTGARAPDGGVTVTLKVKDLGAAARQAALTGTDAISLIWAFRWINGYRPASLSVHWDPVRGFDGGFDDFATGSVTCLGAGSSGVDAKCMTYPGATSVPIDVNTDNGVIRMTAPRALLKSLSGLDAHGRPKLVAATAGARLYSGTAFTMGNVSAPEAQSFLYPVDGSAAFDFVVPGRAPAVVVPPGRGGGSGPAGPPTSGGGLPTTGGGLGWPIAGLAAVLGGLLAARAAHRRAG
jgi:hypothetical protein